MSVPVLFHVTAEPLEDAIIVRASGELDMARAEAFTTLLDLSEVSFIDSAGLHLVEQALHRS